MPRAFVFDAYGTLFDVHAAIGRHRAVYSRLQISREASGVDAVRVRTAIERGGCGMGRDQDRGRG